MPNIRVMLWAALAAVLFLNYEAWMQDYPASRAPARRRNIIERARQQHAREQVGRLGAAGCGSLGRGCPRRARPETAAAPLGGSPMPAQVDAGRRSLDRRPLEPIIRQAPRCTSSPTFSMSTST